jgi:MFS transporter, PPP family, 3-phenylpropionic acid transporter
MSASETTRILAISPLMGFLLPPVVGLVADAARSRGWLMRALSAGAALFFLGFLAARAGALVIYTTAVLMSMCRGPLITLVDASALEVAPDRASYGRLRLWGSVGFLAMAPLGGLLADAAGMDALLVATGVGLSAAAVITWFLPAPPPRHQVGVVSDYLDRLKVPELWLFLGAVVLAAIANAAFDAGFSLHLRRLGHSSTYIGVAWSVGVATEIAVMYWSRTLFLRFGADRLLAFAIGVGALRWLALAHVSGGAILLLQPLHGITYGLYWASSVNVAAERGSPSAPTAAQGLFFAAASLGAVLGMAVSGPILEAYGGRVLFSLASASSALGCATAVAYVLAARRAPATAKA